MAEKYHRSPLEAYNALWTNNNKYAQGLPDLGENQNTENDIETEGTSNGKVNDAVIAEDEIIRKNVWSDVDDELYIAEIIRERTNVRDKRDTSDLSEVVSSVKLEYEMWEIEPTDLTECDCLGPPPEFLLPPPPRPPFLHADYYCGDDPIPDLETCDTEPKSIKEINRLNKQGGAKYGWTKFTDMTADELFMTDSGPPGHQMDIGMEQYKHNCIDRFAPAEFCPDVLEQFELWDPREGIFKDTEFPAKMDWRDSGKVGPVLTQKQCNGCWAFSIVGVMESMVAIQENSDVVSLSIQEILDCRKYDEESGCRFGNVLKQLTYMCNNNMSVVKDSEYPLTLLEENCLIPDDHDPPGRRLGCFNYKKNINEVDIQRLIAHHGPVITVVNADPWRYYLDGVISESCFRTHDDGAKTHVVQIVGYDTTPTYPDLPYYIVRNSWGEDFGIGGYVKLAMYKNICGLADEIYYLMVDKYY